MSSDRHSDLYDIADIDADRPNVIVTGSAGLLGWHVCKRLAEMGYFVFGFDRAGTGEPPKGPHVRDVEFDVTNYSNVRWAMEDVRKSRGDELAAVIHLAAYYDFSGEESPLYKKVTVEGTDRLLNHLQSFKLDKFIFSSTMLIHKAVEPGEHISEDSPLEGDWAYPKSKIETEELIIDGHPQVDSALLRIAGVYNDWGQQPTLVQQIKRIWEKDLQSRVFPGNIKAGQSAVHLEDTVDAIVATVERRATLPPRTPILIGEPDPPSYEALQHRIGELLHGREWSTVRIPQWFAEAGAYMLDKTVGSFVKPFMIEMASDHYALDISRAKELLGWSPKYDLMTHLEVICNNLKNDPDRWYKENNLSR